MTAENVSLDKIDREILSILRADARIGWSELGARVRLSPNAAADRVRRLVRTGVIRRFTVEIDQARLGRTLEAVIDVRIDPHGDDSAARFRDGALQCDEVTWLAHVTGRTDFQVHASCNGTAGLNALLTRFRDEFGALETLTTVVLERTL
jgi:Lrp/AsnC family transcriptional regulator, leucine-responsive regulatory protein